MFWKLNLLGKTSSFIDLTKRSPNITLNCKWIEIMGIWPKFINRMNLWTMGLKVVVNHLMISLLFCRSLINKNFVKFHLISCPSIPFSLKYENNVDASAPFTSNFLKIGKVIPYFDLANCWMLWSVPGSCPPNWLQGNANISNPYTAIHPFIIHTKSHFRLISVIQHLKLLVVGVCEPTIGGHIHKQNHSFILKLSERDNIIIMVYNLLKHNTRYTNLRKLRVRVDKTINL